MIETGRVGVFSTVPMRAPISELREWAQEIERLGYASVWYGEAAGLEAMTTAALLLGCTERLQVGTGIANIYARDPFATAGAALRLSEAYPGRFVLGLGVSHAPVATMRGHDYGRPVATMRAYLDRMDAAQLPELPAKVTRVLAALGPKMLDLARERTDGAFPYYVPVEHTRLARERLGPGKLLYVEQAVAAEGDVQAAREYVDFYLGLENYRNNLLRLGLDPSDPDALVPKLVALGVADGRARVQEHLDAGADHVTVLALPTREPALELLAELAQ